MPAGIQLVVQAQLAGSTNRFMGDAWVRGSRKTFLPINLIHVQIKYIFSQRLWFHSF
jgi:hypothetical protein